MKNISKFFILVTYCLLYSLSSFSQISSRGVPISIQNNLEVTIPVESLPYLDNESEQDRADSVFNAYSANCTKCRMGNNYYGSGLDVSINIKNAGQMLILPDSNKLWLLKIESSTALGMQFYFDKFKIPVGGKLFFYNEDYTILGAFTSRNNPLDTTLSIPFGTQYISGKNIIIEYYEPYGADFAGELQITKIIHIFKNIFALSGGGPWGTSMWCEKNVSCPLGDGWEEEISSVALILGYDASSNLVGHCSGALINNTNEDGRPLFLTAHHCIYADWTLYPEYNYHTWIFLFNHETPDCASDGSDVSNYLGQAVWGSTLLVSPPGPFDYDSPDYLLLELNTTKQQLEPFGVCYAGWTLDLPPQSPFIGIHHPKGDVKKISKASSIIDYSTVFWEVDWDAGEGTVEDGSSGSPLFDVNHRIIGQLFWADVPVGSDFCGPDVLAGYNKLTDSWTHSGSTGLEFYLDPYQTGETHVDTYCPGLVWYPQGGLGGGSSGNCSGDTPHGGGEGNNCYSNLSYRGMTINGSPVGVPVPQITDPIHLAAVPRCACTFGSWDMDIMSKDHGCSSLPNSACGHSFPDFWNCYCAYLNYFIEIVEVDQNLNWIGAPHGGWIEVLFDQWWSDVGDIIVDQNILNTIDMSLINGKYYRIKLAYTHSGTWYESTRHFYYDGQDIYPQLPCKGTDLTITNFHVHSLFPYLYTNKLGASNSIVTSGNISMNGNKHWTAGNFIDLNEGFETEVNAEFLAEIYSCNSGARVLPSGGVNNLHPSLSKGMYAAVKNSKSTPLDIKEEQNANKIYNDFTIIPNPNNGMFSFENFSAAPKDIFIYDTKGSKVYESVNQNKSFPIDLTLHPKGIYFVKVVEDKEISVSKIVIQ